MKQCTYEKIKRPPPASESWKHIFNTPAGADSKKERW